MTDGKLSRQPLTRDAGAGRRRHGWSMYLLQLWEPDDLEDVREFLRRHRVRLHADGGADPRAVAAPAQERRELAGSVTTPPRSGRTRPEGGATVSRIFGGAGGKR